MAVRERQQDKGLKMSIVPSNGQRATVLGLALALGSAVAQDTNQEVAFVVQNAEPVQEVTKPATPPADAKSSAVPANSTATQQPAAQPVATPVTKQADASKPAPQQNLRKENRLTAPLPCRLLIRTFPKSFASLLKRRATAC